MFIAITEVHPPFQLVEQVLEQQMWVHRPHQVLKHDWAPETTRYDEVEVQQTDLKTHEVLSYAMQVCVIVIWKNYANHFFEALITKISRSVDHEMVQKLPKHQPVTLWSLWKHCVLLDCRSPGCHAKTWQVYQITISGTWLGKYYNIFYQTHLNQHELEVIFPYYVYIYIYGCFQK